MVHLYVADITNLPDPKEHPETMKNLPIERRQKMEKLLQVKSRKQSLGAGLLLEKALARHGASMDMLCLNKYGKPEIDGLHFNLSHSGELVACAVSDKPVGCDVEKRKDAPAHIAEHFFCENEKKYLAAFAGGKYNREFFRLWTMKESYMKMTGEGMSLPLSAFEILLGDKIQILRNGQIQNCSIKEYTVLEYQVTVCAEETEFADIFWENI